MIKKIIAITLMVCTLLVGIAPAGQYILGQNQITVSKSSAQIDFPLNLNFLAEVSSKANITDIRLRYQIEQISYANVTAEAYVPFAPSTTVNVKYALNLQRFGGIPPGSTIDYWWVIKDAGGNRLETRATKYQAVDNRYSWRKLSQGNVNLFWYQGDNNFAQALMNSAQQSIASLENDTGAVPTKEINIYIYASARDLQGAMIYPNEWTGGVAYTEFGIIAIGIPTTQLSWGQGAMVHELTHIVVFQMVANPYNNLPVWLNEGLAMYSEGPLDAQFSRPLENAVQKNSLFSVRSISSPFSAYGDQSVQAYAQSQSLIDFLISQYGSAKMAKLLSTFKQGSDYDPAFQSTYGFDMDGLNDLWKTWVRGRYSK